MNKHLVLISGFSKGGKTASLRNIRDPANVMYANCENGKEPSFNCKFNQYTITDPFQVHQMFEVAETSKYEKIHTIIIDSITYLMDMFESVYIIPAANKMEQWSAYAQFFKKLMQNYIAKSSKNVICLAHNLTLLNENDMIMETKVPVKGALKNVGIESFFSTVISATKISLDKLENIQNDMLHITDEEKELEFKHVYQTRITKDTINSRISSPMGLFTKNETYIDNDAQLVIDRLHNYYK